MLQNRHAHSFLLHSKYSDQPKVFEGATTGLPKVMETVKEGITTLAEKAKETFKPITDILKPEVEEKIHENVDIAKEKIAGKTEELKQKIPKQVKSAVEWEEIILAAPTQGVVKEFYCKTGDIVQKSDKLCLIENPTTRIIVCSDNAGKIKDFMVQSGDVVKQNQALFSMETEVKHPGGRREMEKTKKNLEKKRDVVKKIDPLEIYKRQFLKSYYKEEKIRDDILRNNDYVDKNALYVGFDKLFGPMNLD